LIATQLGDLDVVQGLDGVLPYAELRVSGIDVELAGATIPVCGLEHLRTMKQAAGRPRRPRRSRRGSAASRLKPVAGLPDCLRGLLPGAPTFWLDQKL
jgi:hypothetical protein